jgi:formylglycine-generating enzyme required for sulfatase activity
MKVLHRSIFGLAVTASIALVLPAFSAVSIDWVTVGNAGNTADPLTGYGGVAYEFNIAKNETTIGQYSEFLNAAAKSDPYGLYNTDMSSSYINGISRSGSFGSYIYTVNPGSANKPIGSVDWFDAARFCNWLHNGQGNGSTESGAYTLNGAMSGIYMVNPGAKTWIPSENEWYKAAYYDATKGANGGYWRYPTQSNTLGGNTIGNPNSANYYEGDLASYPGPWMTDVGAYGTNSDSFYGTNDQGGNVWEWNDAATDSSRGLRGGSCGPFDNFLDAWYRNEIDPSFQAYLIGFRVASSASAVPEPASTLSTLALVSSGLLIRRRAKNSL